MREMPWQIKYKGHAWGCLTATHLCPYFVQLLNASVSKPAVSRDDGECGKRLHHNPLLSSKMRIVWHWHRTAIRHAAAGQVVHLLLRSNMHKARQCLPVASWHTQTRVLGCKRDLSL
jgi:hypothetical protein